MKRSKLGLLILSAAFAATSCGGVFESDDDGGSSGSTTGSSQTSTLSVKLTDAPFENWMVLEAKVTIDGLYLHEDANATSGFTPVMTAEFTTDLSKLANGITQVLANAEMPLGSYRQARISIKQASMRLVNGRTFSTGNGSLIIAGHGAYGFKLVLDPALEVQEGLTTRALVDFDMSKSFRAQPVDDPLNANTILLLPSIRCVDVAKCGEIRGAVEAMDPLLGQMQPVAEAFVYILPPGETDVEARIATTSTETDGSFAFLGVDPASYDLVVVKGAKDRENGVLVTAGNVTSVDLEIE